MSYKIYKKYKKNDDHKPDKNGEAALGSRFAKYFIELTINPPRRGSKYSQLKSNEQMKFLHTILRNVSNLQYEIVNSCYESSADGNYHMHALLKTYNSQLHFPLVEVADIAKTVIYAVHSKKFAIYTGELLHKEWIRYCAPSVVVQYKSIDDPHVDIFNSYIDKYKSPFTTEEVKGLKDLNI